MALHAERLACERGGQGLIEHRLVLRPRDAIAHVDDDEGHTVRAELVRLQLVPLDVVDQVVTREEGTHRVLV